jgi:activator of 2-hydroxyglutaryl-CoA dehydratase
MVMLTAGIDVGAATAKTVIFEDGKIIGYAIKPVGYDMQRGPTSRYPRPGLSLIWAARIQKP